MKKRENLKKLIFYIVGSAIAVIMVMPFIWSLLTSIKPDTEIFRIPLQWLPSTITFEQYIEAFESVPFGRYLFNSLYLAVMGVFFNLLFGSMSGYAFAKLKFKGRKVIFAVLLAAMMIPGVVVMIPQYIVLNNMPLMGGNDILGQGGHGLLNNFWAVILPGAAGSFAVFFMRQFFLTLPDEYMESARIDGCSEFRIYWNLYLPLTKPALATLGIFTFQAGWNSFLWPLIVLNDRSLYTVQIGLQAFTFDKQTAYGPMMAATIIIILPIIAIFMYLQKYFIDGANFSGIKS
ncbi:carbohydrate ABC transporter permease [Metabacillus niabensis]|uniref:carbohydrate ABC transporter permease n=1 Tax=Metabacillus niabensis TaxID=324854 RepID=UPI001CFBF2D4|nr:carbohydrate ABC transporter permease [Metabacillus niabensis]